MLKMSVKDLNETLNIMKFLVSVCETKEDLVKLIMSVDEKVGKELVDSIFGILPEGCYEIFRNEMLKDPNGLDKIISEHINNGVDAGEIILTE